MDRLDNIKRGMERRRASEPRVNNKTTACYYGIDKNSGERLYFLRVNGELINDIVTQSELDEALNAISNAAL